MRPHLRLALGALLACGDSDREAAPSERDTERDGTPISPERARDQTARASDGTGANRGDDADPDEPPSTCTPGETRACGSEVCPAIELCIETPGGAGTWQLCDVAAAFVDPALEASVRRELRVPEGPISRSATSQLDSLFAGGSGVSRLDGLECLPALTDADLFNNALTSLAPLAGLRELTQLTLQGNSISDLTPLAALTKLEALTLHGNAISELGALAGMTRLQVLFLSINQISDVAPLQGLSELQGLYLGSNQLSEIAPLASLGRLVLLDLTNNAITDVAPLGALTNLVELQLGQNQIENLDALIALPALERLYVQGNPLDCAAPSFAALKARLRLLTSDCP